MKEYLVYFALYDGGYKYVDVEAETGEEAIKKAKEENESLQIQYASCDEKIEYSYDDFDSPYDDYWSTVYLDAILEDRKNELIVRLATVSAIGDEEAAEELERELYRDYRWWR